MTNRKHQLVSRARLAMFFGGFVATIAMSAADVLSTWDGTTNDWSSPEHWSHSAPSALGFPSNGVQNYDVVIPSGAVTITQPIVIDGLQMQAGRLIFSNALTVLSNFVWSGGEIDGSGSLVLTNGGNLLALASMTNPLAVRIDGGALVAASNYAIAGSLFLSNGIVSGSGEVVVASNATASFLTASVTGTGIWRVESGARTEIASDTWLPPTVISRPIDNCGDLEIVRNVRSEGVITNRGLLHVSGRPGWESWLAKGPVLNDGELVVSGDAQVTLTSCTNRGLIEVRGILGMGDWWMSIPGLLVQDAGDLRLNQGRVAANVEIRSGSISGDGTNEGIVTVSGVVAPGAPFGTLWFEELRLLPGATVQLDIGGTQAGTEFDRITCRSSLRSLSNVTVDVRLANNFLPQVGDAFEVMTFSSFTSSTNNGYVEPIYPRFRGLSLTNGVRLAPIVTISNLTLVALPAPAPEQVRLGASVLGNAPGWVTLQWSPECTGFILQSTTDLNLPWRTEWMIRPGIPPVLSPPVPQRFFRLVDPEIH